MSSTVMIENTDISITTYCSQVGKAYQVTWRSSDKEHLFDWVSFKDYDMALEFIKILKNRIK